MQQISSFLIPVIKGELIQNTNVRSELHRTWSRNLDYSVSLVKISDPLEVIVLIALFIFHFKDEASVPAQETYRLRSEGRNLNRGPAPGASGAIAFDRRVSLIAMGSPSISFSRIRIALQGA